MLSHFIRFCSNDLLDIIRKITSYSLYLQFLCQIWQLHGFSPVAKVLCINRGRLSKGRRLIAGCRVLGKAKEGSEPSSPPARSREVLLRSSEVGSGPLLGFENHQLLNTTHY